MKFGDEIEFVQCSRDEGSWPGNELAGRRPGIRSCFSSRQKWKNRNIGYVSNQVFAAVTRYSFYTLYLGVEGGDSDGPA